MEINKINIIGFGNVGQNLFYHLDSKVEIVNVYNRSISKNTAELLGSRLVGELEMLSNNVDLNIISSTDGSIELIQQCLPKNIPVVHTSGSINLDVLNDFKLSGVFYPLQTFSKNRIIEMNTVPFLLESNSKLFRQALTMFTNKYFSDTIFEYDSSQREKIHLAAVFINNFTTLMVRESMAILSENNMDSSILKPLLLETVNKIIDSKDLSHIQTGPAQREDMTVIKKHLNQLGLSSQKEIYNLLSNRIIELKLNS